jgi:hypothetical protein
MLPIVTDKPPGVAWVSAQPEFGDYKAVNALYGFSRSHLYMLLAQGKIKSACIRREGSRRGRRLFHLGSIREFLSKNMEGGEE